MLPHPDIWLRDVLDQQFMGHSWSQVQRGFEAMIGAGVLYAHTWPTSSWAFPDRDQTFNEDALGSVPAEIKVISRGGGSDGFVTLRDDLGLDCIGGEDRYVLETGTKMDLEIGHVSPLKTYHALTHAGAIARFPYGFEAPLAPCLFILACSEPKEWRP